MSGTNFNDTTLTPFILAGSGTTVTTSTVGADITVSSGTYADTGLSVTFTTLANETVQLGLMAKAYAPIPTGFLVLGYQLDSEAEVDCITEGYPSAGYTTNISFSVPVFIAAAGTHTIKLRAYKINQNCIIQYSTSKTPQFSVTQYRAIAPTPGVWVDYSAASTIVGWGSFTTKVLRYMVEGKKVFVEFYIIGTSNSVDTSFTLPYKSADVGMYYGNLLQYAADNTITCAVGCKSQLPPNDNVILLYPTFIGGSGSWTAGGMKAVLGSFWYEIP